MTEKLQSLTAPTGAKIIGTYEIFYGVAFIDGASQPTNDGAELDLHFNGTTDVDWNTQTPVRQNGERLFVDENNRLWQESQLTLSVENPK